MEYDRNYKPDLNKLPDPQVTCNIEGARVGIRKVGIRNFKVPFLFNIRGCNQLEKIKTTLSMYVDLDNKNKGINMSRLPRTIYKYIEDERGFDNVLLVNVLDDFKKELNAKNAYIKAKFSYPYKQESLRSGLVGYQYYDCEIEGNVDDKNNYKFYLTVYFVYSSACPCSFELSEHAREERNIKAIPHSQRSVAKVTVEFDPMNIIYIEDLIDLLRKALNTETQVMVKREDEQAFAELNGVYPKFVEDATRLIYDKLIKQSIIKDFVVVCEHFESLHSHNAVAVINKGVDGGLK